MTPELRAALIEKTDLLGYTISEATRARYVDAIGPMLDAALRDYGHRMHEAGVLDERSEAFRQHRSATAKAALLDAADALEAKCMTEDVEDWHCPHDYAEWLRARANEESQA